MLGPSCKTLLVMEFPNKRLLLLLNILKNSDQFAISPFNTKISEKKKCLDIYKLLVKVYLTDFFVLFA